MLWTNLFRRATTTKKQLEALSKKSAVPKYDSTRQDLNMGSACETGLASVGGIIDLDVESWSIRTVLTYVGWGKKDFI